MGGVIWAVLQRLKYQGCPVPSRRRSNPLPAIPTEAEGFAALLKRLFPRPDQIGLAVRELTPPASPPITVVYIRPRLAPERLERLVLAPLALGKLAGSPAVLARSGRFPAPALRVADDPKTLRDGLYAGLAAIHFAGHPSALLVGPDQAPLDAKVFGPDLTANLALLAQHLPVPEFRQEEGLSTGGIRSAVAYVEGAAPPETVRRVANWARSVSLHTGKLPFYSAFLGHLRLPPMVEQSSPVAMAAFLRRGYVALLADHLSSPQLAPTTFELLLSGPQDVALSPALRQLVRMPRLAAAIAGLLLSANVVAISGYHHSLMPGPFLVALAASRQNMPLPVTLEVLLISLLGDAAEAAALMVGGKRLALLAWVGTVLAAMAGMQVGIIGAITGLSSILAVIARTTLPSAALRRVVHVWRYWFVAAAAGLGMYGLTLLGFALVVYLGEERAFGHPVRTPVNASA